MLGRDAPERVTGTLLLVKASSLVHLVRRPRPLCPPTCRESIRIRNIQQLIQPSQSRGNSRLPRRTPRSATFRDSLADAASQVAEGQDRCAEVGVSTSPQKYG